MFSANSGIPQKSSANEFTRFYHLAKEILDLRDYESLDVWKKSHQLVLQIYETVEKFPEDEKYALVDQNTSSMYFNTQ